MPTKPAKVPFRELPFKKQFELANPGVKFTPEMEEKYNKLMELFDEVGIDYSKFKPEHLSFITGKTAYPNYDQYIYAPGQHDMKKWLMAVKDIHYKQKAGLPYKEAIRSTVGDWKKMEVFDFLNWLKFYSEGTQMKYKFAQVWYTNDQPGYFLHIKPDPPAEPEPKSDGASVDRAAEEAERNEEKRNVIEKQRQKIIGRLDSAEKLLRSPEGQQFAGNELEQLMEAIYTLKKKVQLVNKLSVSTRLYEDMIVREGNVLKRSGFDKAASVLYSLAQSPGQSGESAQGVPGLGGKTPTDTPPPPDPSGAGQSGTMRGSPQVPAPGTPDIQTPVEGDQNKDQPPVPGLAGNAPPPGGAVESTPAIVPQENDIKSPSVNQFIRFMNEGNKTETVSADDALEVADDMIEVAEYEMLPLVSTAQVAPPPGPPAAALEDVPMTDEPTPARGTTPDLPAPTPKAPDAPKAGADEEPLEVTEEDLPTGAPPTSNFDSRMDELLKNVTIQDVVAELESISRDYKTREQPRRLAYVDMMLDSLGLASMFPSLSEAQNKALEATNYISTRVDDILAKLRGAIASQEKPEAPAAERPEVAGIKGKLQSDQDKEAKRKQMRKEQEAAELEGGAGKETPAVEMGELAPPAAPAPPPPTPRPLG